MKLQGKNADQQMAEIDAGKKKDFDTPNIGRASNLCTVHFQEDGGPKSSIIF